MTSCYGTLSELMQQEADLNAWQIAERLKNA